MRPVNLLPEEERAREAGRLPGSAYAIVGVLAVLLAMVTAYVLTTNQVGAREADTAAAKRDAGLAQARIAQLGPFGNFTEIKQVRVASVTGLSRARFDWERFVRELALVLPRGSWLTEVDAATSGEGESAGGTAPVASGPHAKLKGCALRQPDVAKLMVRLRKMNRVEDVELKESARARNSAAAAAGPAPAASPGGAASAQDCAPRYEFDLLVQFAEAGPIDGPRRVPASLGGGG